MASTKMDEDNDVGPVEVEYTSKAVKFASPESMEKADGEARVMMRRILEEMPEKPDN
jgi:hypothetical protein